MVCLLRVYKLGSRWLGLIDILQNESEDLYRRTKGEGVFIRQDLQGFRAPYMFTHSVVVA